ncbi:hypothetical protein Tco_0997398, partial [Tanacetum coccineum]
KNETSWHVSDKESDKNEKGRIRSNKGKFSRDKGIETGMSSERMNVDERVFSNTVKVKNGGGKNINKDGGSSKGNAKRGFDSQNMFSVLSDAAEIEKRLMGNMYDEVYRDEHNRIEDVVYEVEDVDSLFTKRLNADVALDLIKPVDDKEIKEDLFSIDDNKASGPDGYLSKFFKANRINDWKNRNLSFAGRLLLISSVLASLQVYWGSLFIFPMSVCEKIDKLLRHLWNVASDKDSIWVKWVKVHRLKAGLSLNARFCDLINNGNWVWPSEWEGRFDEVLDVLVPNIAHDLDDKVVWIDKKGKEKRFSVAEAWKAVKIEFPKVIWHKHVCLFKWVSVSVAWSRGRTGLWDGNKVFDSDVLVTGGFLCISLDECMKERRDGNPFLGSNMDYFSLDIHVLKQILVLIVARLGAFQDKQDQSLCQRLLLWYKYEVLGNLGRRSSLFSLLGVFPIGFYLDLAYGDGSWSADWSH